MIKIGILTINDYSNYGNRLQNFAMHRIMESNGFSACTIINETSYEPEDSPITVKQIILRLLKMNVYDVLIKIIKILKVTLRHKQISEAKLLKINKLKKFTRKYIKESSFAITSDFIPQGIENDYDFFITGSDQVWNPNFRNCSPIDFLTFAPKNKRVAICPSFGISDIPYKYIEKYKIYLSGIDYISVREYAGKKIVKDLTGREVPVLIDPTMMIDKNEWKSISQKSTHKPQNNYILLYYLGKLPKGYYKQIKKIAKDRNLDIVNLSDSTNPNMMATGVEEFIDFFDSSSLILTDSFHATVFSMLFKKPFGVFYREGNEENIHSRIDTILSKFDFEQRKISSQACLNDSIFSCDYDGFDAILTNEKECFDHYINNIIK